LDVLEEDGGEEGEMTCEAEEEEEDTVKRTGDVPRRWAHPTISALAGV